MDACTANAPIARGRTAYADVLGGAGGHEIQSAARSDDGVAPAVAIYASPPYDVDVPALGVARLSINLSHSMVTGRVAGERVRSFVARRHSLFLTPAGAEAHWRKEQPSRHINIYFDDRQSAPLLNVTLPGLKPLLELLSAELSAPQAFAAEALDSLARLILIRLLRRSAEASANPVTPALLARLRDFVRANLDQPLLVADLARVAGLPSNRFAQAFAASSGHSPHQFVIAQRLQCARDLLQRSSAPLADVAAACGFAHQQHMTQLMRRRLGTTPARVRDARAA